MADPVRVALYEALSADAALTGLLATAGSIYHRVAPQDAAAPFVVFQANTGAPAWTFAGAPLSSELWVVKAVDRASSASRAEQIAAAIDVALTDTAALPYVRRETDVDYGEQDAGDMWHHVGGAYRVWAAPQP